MTCPRVHRQFRQPGSGALPPLLWTFPGSGNTWLRLLLDFATGTYTGSVYSDVSLLPLLPGEGTCDSRALAVKAHPTNVDFHDFVRTPGEPGFRLNVTRKPAYLKCAPLRFDALVMLTRDPYASIWAEYKRALAYAEGVGRAPVVATSSCRAALRSQHLHSGGLPAACFNATHFSTFALHQARAWRHMWYHYRKAAALGLRVHRLAYENLLEPRGRLGALARLVEFADDPRVHRGRHQRDGSPQLASAASAYASSGLVCDMWHLFGAKAKAAGYRPFGKERCGVAHGKRSKRNNAG
ncbi:Hypothetical protein EMIHUDRAFT_198564 [Emiliania huxleyi CCMP1516]|uniref:Sulfotransferase domain-containing protein n=2 Tax=Emiliania huxleyi TaxID=2903 RepID=A0A0D3I7I3_EMIH1|nr:Hypothetical protein EMIHUDRAFT_198564 [Emiliania huxleyi CCMP1516]EOD07218.1 Hypothetical protein EMIHUDRAFT_198564 [Emiliania huxleyi CCMP1516]|eukprot:XP_005759647.1 Hypothetical protein EMIHUDRAFT_198564 [Emiliania huxleyi CCMP1516]